MAAGSNIDLCAEQIKEFSPQVVSVSSIEISEKLRPKIAGLKTQILFGEEGLLAVATHSESEFVIAGMSGTKALKPTLAAIAAKKNIGLANKELLVSAGALITAEIKKYDVALIPIDSEHSAIWQSLSPHIENRKIILNTQEINKIIITGSGGPFRQLPAEKLNEQTPVAALKHPNWSMGKKITIDSATLFNKGLEVIEAHFLFGISYQNIEVLIHPQSIIHSMVEFIDGSVVGQLGLPDMKLPIQYAMAFPKRIQNKFPRLDLAKIQNLTFEKPDLNKFPGLKLAYEAGEAGGTMPAVMNAANETAVHLFLESKIKFTDIPVYVKEKMQKHQNILNPDLEAILKADAEGRA
jgi:1-deoxy-D-xylulose-5-phosphate reductoisomerase